MYYKIVSAGIVIDACDVLNYVRWQEQNRVFLECSEHLADGFLSYDGSRIYLFAGGRELDLPDGADYPIVTAEEISADEFRDLREEIDAGEQIPAPDEPDPVDPSQPQTRLKQIEEQMEALMEQNTMLIECLLEMSEIVYG